MNSIIILSACLIILGVYSSFVFAKNKQHPRELFAFFSLLAWSGWLLLFTVESKSYSELDRGYSSRVMSFEEWIFGLLFPVLLTFGILWFIIRIHNSWPSDVISKRDFWRQARNKKSSIFISAWDQLCTFLSLQWMVKLYQEPPITLVNKIIESVDATVVPWRTTAIEILNLLNPQYKVHQAEDWYSDQDCYLCSYGKEADGTILFCCEEKPSDASINQLMQFILERDSPYKTILVLIEQGDQLPSEELRGGFLVKYHYKAEMLEKLINFAPYFKHLKEYFEEAEVHLGSNKTLADIYTPLSAYTNTSSIKDAEQYILEWAAQENSVQQLALLGEYGQGKSVLSLKISLELSKIKKARIPILIELRGKSPRNMSVQELLFIWAQKYSVSPEALLKLHQEGRLLLIFEGFDEMDLSGDKSTRLAHFQQLWKFAKAPKAKLLFTGRPNFFVDDVEQSQALGIRQQPIPLMPYCEVLSLQLFSAKQLLTNLEKVAPYIQKSILPLLEKDNLHQDNSFYNMIARPATLSLLTIIWKEAHFDQRKNQLNSALVIKEYIQLAYDRQIKRQNLMPLSTTERQYFMLGIAVGMMQLNGYSNQISSHQLSYFVEQLLLHFPTALSREQTALEFSRVSLKERLLEEGEVLPARKEAILTDIRTCGILVKDTTKADHFKFAHKSFLEYLVSEYYVATLYQEATVLKRMTYGIQRAIEQANHLQQSPEVIQFIGELLAHKASIKTTYSTAQYFYTLLEINQISLYFAFMRKKTYLLPVPFLVVLMLGFLFSLVVILLIITLLIAIDQPVNSTFPVLFFYLLWLLFYLFISKKVNHQNEAILLRTHIWYKTCQIGAVEREAMRSVTSNFTLKFIERYLKRIGALPAFYAA